MYESIVLCLALIDTNTIFEYMGQMRTASIFPYCIYIYTLYMYVYVRMYMYISTQHSTYSHLGEA